MNCHEYFLIAGLVLGVLSMASCGQAPNKEPELEGIDTPNDSLQTDAGGAAGAAGSAGSAGSAGTSGSSGTTGSVAGGSSGQPTGGSDAGTSGGSGESGGTSKNLIACNGYPSTCQDISQDKNVQFYGCCAGNVAFWCDGESGTWGLRTRDCGMFDETCTYNQEYEAMYCTKPYCTPDSCPAGKECIGNLCLDPPCSVNPCPVSETCVNEKCILDPGPGPGLGPGTSCDHLPPLFCSGSPEYCGELVRFEPDNNPNSPDYDPSLGYIDYPVNGETWSNQYRSYVRRDLMMLIKYATALVACKAASWTGGHGKPLGLVDMSEANGAIPGTSIGQPGHPVGTHTNGLDMDVAYYQQGTLDNQAREICDHTLNGGDVYRCTTTPHLLDVWRTAMFIGVLHDHPSLRVVGCDGKAGPMIEPALSQLCADGWLDNAACNPSTRALAYEPVDKGHGWFRFHHHHLHVSFSP